MVRMDFFGGTGYNAHSAMLLGCFRLWPRAGKVSSYDARLNFANTPQHREALPETDPMPAT